MFTFLEGVYQGPVGRFLRVALGTFVGAALAKHKAEPVLIAVTPLLSMGGKYLRDRWPGVWEWLPF